MLVYGVPTLQSEVLLLALWSSYFSVTGVSALLSGKIDFCGCGAGAFGSAAGAGWEAGV